jgi:hypothetical protein
VKVQKKPVKPKKRKERGGFEERIVLLSVDD